MIQATPSTPESGLAESQGRGVLARLFDLHARVALGAGQQVVLSANGLAYVIPIGLPTGQTDIAPFDRMQAQSNIPGLAVPLAQVEVKARGLLNSIEGLEAGMDYVEFPLDSGDGWYRGIGLVAGLAPAHAFQVIHMGGSRWWVAGGELRFPRGTATETLTVAAREVNRREGWVFVQVSVVPEVLVTPGAGGGGFVLQAPAETGAAATLEQVRPAKTVVSTGDAGLGDQVVTDTWSPGVWQIPLAYVYAPGVGGRQRPEIIRCVGGNINTSPPLWQGGFPTVT